MGVTVYDYICCPRFHSLMIFVFPHSPNTMCMCKMYWPTQKRMCCTGRIESNADEVNPSFQWQIQR